MTKDTKEENILSFPTSRIHRASVVNPGPEKDANSKEALEKLRESIIKELANGYVVAIMREVLSAGVGMEASKEMASTGVVPQRLRKHLVMLAMSIEAVLCRFEGIEHQLDTTIDNLIDNDVPNLMAGYNKINIPDFQLSQKINQFLEDYSKSPRKVKDHIKKLKEAIDK